MSDATALAALGISKRYPGVVALDSVDLELRAGEVHALMGENGAGKSTLVKVLTGVAEPDAGAIRVRGVAARFRHPRDAERFGVSVVHQEILLAPNLSVAENLTLNRAGVRRFGVLSRRAMRRRARAMLESVGVEARTDAIVGSLPVAVRQLVAIARAVGADAGSEPTAVLILDEPTASLDERESDRLAAVIRRCAARGTAILLVTHGVAQMERLADRVSVLRNGRLVGSWQARGLARETLVSAMLGRVQGDATTARERRMQSSERVVLEARGLGRSRAIRPFSMSLRSGEIVGFVGLLGSGRTDALRLLAGADRASAGTRRVLGRRTRRPSIAVGLCPEDRRHDGQVGALTLREAILLSAQVRQGWLRRIRRAESRRLVERAIAEFDIRAASANVRVSTLSGGNQQKAILARWTLADPAALLLDEPTRGIDVGAKSAIRTIVARLRGEGIGIVWVSGEIDETLGMSDRALVFRDRAVVGELDGARLDLDSAMRAIAGADA